MNNNLNVAFNNAFDINVEISEVDHYMWIFTSRIFRLLLFYVTSTFSYKWLTSYSHKVEKLMSASPNKSGVWGVGKFFEKISGGDTY